MNENKPVEVSLGSTTCGKCLQDLNDEDHSVTCSQCKTLYHHKCVQINDNVDNWVCPTCAKHHIQIPPAPSAPSAHKSSRSKASSRAKLYEEQKLILAEEAKLLALEIEMKQKAAQEEARLYNEMIEKQRKASEELQKTFNKQREVIDKKKKMLEETILSISSGSSRGSMHNSLAASKEKVNSWMQSNPLPVDVQILPSSTINNNLIRDFDNQPHDRQVKGKQFTPNENPLPKDPHLFPSSTFHTNLIRNFDTQPHNLQLKETMKTDRNSTAHYIAKTELTKSQIAAMHVVKGLPNFDGNPLEWARFKSALERSTNLCGFDNDENLERLSISLKGNAFEAVKNRLSTDQVCNIMADLREVFARPEFIINELLKNLRAEPSPSLNNLDSVIRYSLQIENLCISMRDAELSEYLWDPNLLKEVKNRLPTPLKLDWATYKCASKVKVNFEVFSMWLKGRATSYLSILTGPPNLIGSKGKSRGFTNVHDSKESCCICRNGDHCVEGCPRFQDLPLNEKWNEIKKNSLCRQCLRFHKSRRCPNKNVLCNVNGCKLRHHSLLHNTMAEVEPIIEENQDEQGINIHHNSTNETYFKILPVKLFNGSNECIIHAILDDCSSVTLLDSDIATKLKARGEKIPLCLKWTNGVRRREDHSLSVNLQISPIDQERKYKLHDVRTVNSLNLPVQTVHMEELQRLYDHLKKVPLKSYENVRPQLLIGLKHAKLHEVSKYCSNGNSSPSACRTVLGWTVYGGGNAGDESSVHHASECNCSTEADLRLENIVRQNYSLESIGISSPKSIPMSTYEKRAYEILGSTARFEKKRWEIGLLWKFADVSLPKSYKMAYKRQECLERRAKTDLELIKTIDSQIQQYIQKGYASELQNWSKDDVNCWYLPIFVVKNHNKPGKIRLVWDAAATVGGISLNTVLLKGPDLVASLRFRQYEIALSGDIKEMFHQVAIREEDRQYQRFLWRNSPTDKIKAFVMNVMTFGASCSPACAQYVKNENAERFRLSHAGAVEAIISNHYVDDWLQSVGCVEDAIKLAEDVKFVHAEGGFEIRNWTSNSTTVAKHLKSFSENMKSLDIALALEGEKVLGLFWETRSDCFVYQLNFNNMDQEIIKTVKVPTKREVLKLLMSVFDPLGLISHILIFLKVLMQRIWRSNIQWDEEITKESFDLWQSWMNVLPSIKELRIPRWIGIISPEDIVEMHTFTDASEDAYSAVIYFKIINANGSHVSLITSKSRVAPLKALSVPRLELQAAVLGTRLARTTQENHNHKIVRRYFWTDSQTVLQWIHSDTRKYNQFVSCRIGEILESSSSSEWRWIEGKLNVADLATKMRIPEISTKSLWFQGPETLKNNDHSALPESFSEMSKEELRSQFVCIHEETIFRVEKWTKLRRVFAYVIRYVRNLYCATKQMPLKTGPVSSEEYQSAERILLSRAQKEGFSEEYRTLDTGGVVSNKQSCIYKDSPFMDPSGIIRSRSRIGDAPHASYDARRPILLPKCHRITDMILRFYHERYFHRFPNTVLNEVKQKFVIQGLRVKLQSIRKLCQKCKNDDARPEVPEEAELPAARLTAFTRPFTFIGIDYFGPTNVVIGRRHEKRWCMLITCLTTRALHLEVAHTLNTNSCIMGLRRFISRRGAPREIYSDNGTNFRGSKRELREIWEQIDKNKVAETFIDSETQWKFIPPASPHMGGAWERMVRTVKTSLKASISSLRVPTDELLLTMLAEVENIINSRPLTYVPLGNEDEEALTPNHFILGSSSGMKPLGEFTDNPEILRQNWQKAQQLANRFWRRWVREYLPMLCRRTKWFSSSAKEPIVGDIVIVVGDEKKGNWPKGKIVELHRGRDNKVRSVRVQLASGTFVRPVSRIAILDVLNENLENSSSLPGRSVENSHPVQTSRLSNPPSDSTSLSEHHTDSPAIDPSSTFSNEQ